MPHSDAPLAVSLVVYDLLPPSRLASVLNALGSGVYHSSICISLPSPSSSRSRSAPVRPQEIAFGGHATAGQSGIFSIPKGTAGSRMPGLRFFAEVSMGNVIIEEVGEEKDGYHGLSGGSPNAEGRSGGRSEDESVSFQGQDDGLNVAERRAWSVIEEMKGDPYWWGTHYQLLGRNCNSFTDELLYRLTGKRSPAWINRAAWVATSLPCLVPEGWIDDVDPDPAEERRVIVEPPRADRMGTRTGSGSSQR